MTSKYMPRKAKMFLDELDIEVAKLAQKIGLTQGSLYKKLRNEQPIKITEARFIVDKINEKMDKELTIDEVFFYGQVAKSDKKAM